MPYPFEKSLKRVRNIPRSGLASGILPSSPEHIETSQSTGRGIPQCEHLETEYQPYEPEVNAPESLSCADCGADLPLEGECI